MPRKKCLILYGLLSPINVSFSFSQPAEASNTELAKQREIEKEKEDLMDEGDFLEYKVSRIVIFFFFLFAFSSARASRASIFSKARAKLNTVCDVNRSLPELKTCNKCCELACFLSGNFYSSLVLKRHISVLGRNSMKTKISNFEIGHSSQ